FVLHLKDGKKSDVKHRPQKQICSPVLEHFDKQYSQELGDSWNSVKETLLSPSCWQYAVLLNRFRFCSKLERHLESLGYQSLFKGAPAVPQLAPQCYISRTQCRFPAQQHQPGRLKEYYLLNAASLLPVLALEVKRGDRVLDMCAAPGGKSVALLQCATPGHLVCNEYDGLRLRRLSKTLDSFIPEDLKSTIAVAHLDGRQFGHLQPEAYNKVLVDAPCSNDRSWLYSSDALQAAVRIAHRAQLPALQIQLLRSAIAALRPGGTVVYSTCTLSRAENSEVIARILNSCDSVHPVDLTELSKAFSDEFTLATGIPHGLLVLPDKDKTWGPMYVAKLKKSWTF
uniref:NOP2/Sun RNA methyltransferase 3 n=1 Tax=Latimeria chalumnae TaxID=7897 RepID=H3AAD9_LATCH